MDRLDILVMFTRPLIFVVVPAWLFYLWMDAATLGAIIGFSYMWNFLATRENAELSLAFKEVREELDTIKASATRSQPNAP